ncbi:hypothetical protein AFCDBAGC_3549 [Methylobacterium cerastii]|uniref:Uncharacterized protein n=1 Tax=Methylobacterium cerastii TaxID=932741 RepID=A0ABQ4QK98_9HYPH|nr:MULTISPECIES: hypothetical protein [Methylobacterium]TXM71558.1 hypothetical protein FV226_14880 [Methylobacterium sp. WL12]TXN80602.1 hypothetical protein FV234_16365 [Methylobacterium sp. WL8]GJD45675.1 hypothetical protein AFCDBAGC_3549 [Methylobacterium cerastii]
MLRSTRVLILSLCLGCGLAGAASAQSVGAPAGREAATAPGGAIGRAGPANRMEAIRSGDAYGRRRMRRHRHRR